jgi:formate hydrogenlyase subunit 3/multisubunit Na+/H+ antiporter MnhD subunit
VKSILLPIFFCNGIIKDPISIFFAIIIFIVFVPIFIYSIGYAREYKGKYSVKYNFILMVLFAISMLCVVLAQDSITFIVFWEIMSAVSFFLVIYEYKNKENIKSGIMYFIMTHISGLFLMIMFAFLYKYTGSTSFDKFYQLSNSFTVSEKYIIFIFAILGFGAKAGVVPLHGWLPKAHPSATSNASALMSGVMLKVALYGLIRVTFTFIKVLPLKAALLLVVLGVVTAIFSALNALVQKDIKKLLAYSSAENIGIILSTLGLSLVFYNLNLISFANLTLIAALFHILNHAIFKSLLFASAGSVLYASGTKNMNELGGLYKKMKFAAICAFIGTAAISAIPPLNGFASEILIFKCFIIGTTSIKGTWTALIIIVCGLIIALTSGVTLYASVKSFGITYLGAARSEKALSVHKIPLSMNIGLGILALLCIISGVFSPFIINLISKVSNSILNTNLHLIHSEINNEIIIVSSIFVITIAILVLISKILNNKKTTVIKETWGCGFNNFNPNMQYSANGLSEPSTRIFGKIVGYEKDVKNGYSISLKDKVLDNIEKYIYGSVVKFAYYIAVCITKIHFGKIQVYVSYIFGSLLVTVLLVNMLI